MTRLSSFKWNYAGSFDATLRKVKQLHCCYAAGADALSTKCALVKLLFVSSLKLKDLGERRKMKTEKGFEFLVTDVTKLVIH